MDDTEYPTLGHSQTNIKLTIKWAFVNLLKNKTQITLFHDVVWFGMIDDV